MNNKKFLLPTDYGANDGNILFKGMFHQKASNIKNIYSIPYRYIVWNNVRKFQENRRNGYWSTRLSVGIAEMWYLSNHFLSSANISVSTCKN